MLLLKQHFKMPAALISKIKVLHSNHEISEIHAIPLAMQRRRYTLYSDILAWNHMKTN